MALRFLFCALMASTMFAQAPRVYGVLNFYDLFGSNSRLSPGVLALDTPDLTPQTAVTVQVGGRPAPVFGFHPDGRIIQIPVDLVPGPAEVLVSTAAGSLAPFQITLDSYAPALPVVSDHAATGVFEHVGLAGSSPVTCQTPAIPVVSAMAALGWPLPTLRVQAVGLGPTDPVVPTGTAAPVSP